MESKIESSEIQANDGTIKTKFIRNIAFIAHVDHGKTTFVDSLFRGSHTFRDNEKIAERAMDSNDLERERGITILAKNTKIVYKEPDSGQVYTINIVDTPGHADFGGEVERSLKMADAVFLLVDAYEGCMPQTRFVLKKALNLGLKLIIVVNKMDRPNARPKEVVDEILELLIDLDATEEQLDSPIIYASAREGWASNSDSERGESMRPIFDAIVNFAPPPVGDVSGPFQMLVSNIDYDEYTGRIAVGKVERGKTSTGQSVTVVKRGGKTEAAKITKIFSYSGLKKVEVESAEVGEIVAVSGITGINIGETICELGNSDALPFVEIDEPVLSMTFCVNDSPFAGKEGKFVTSRHLRERLFRETDSNISLRVEETDTTESFKVSGRGELHLSVLIENMRREGYEFQVSKPVVINKIIDGVKSEPMEHLSVDVPDEFCGAVIETTSNRRGQMKNMQPISDGYTRLEFRVPSRGLIGYRSLMMNLTKGTAIINHTLDGYEPFRGDMQYRTRGSLVSFESGESVTYGLYNAQERGTLFIGPNVKVYMGMVVGENSRADDLVVNVCKQKHVSNMRASGSDDALKLSPPRIFSLEQCIDFIGDDELLEVTPVSLRMRKKILDNGQRAKLRGKKVGE